MQKLILISFPFTTASTAAECEQMIQDTLQLFDNSAHESGTTCSPGKFSKKKINVCKYIIFLQARYSCLV